MQETDYAAVKEIRDFWFGAEDSPEYGQNRACWFKKSDDFDQACRDLLVPYYERAAEDEYDHWFDHEKNVVALLVLLDQVPRNVFRGTAQAFATDAKARVIARKVLGAGMDKNMNDAERMFVYLPLEHSENYADQEYSVELFRGLGNEVKIDYAIRHFDVIKRFGRFPHRNEALGRTSTPEETVFLKQPNSSF